MSRLTLQSAALSALASAGLAACAISPDPLTLPQINVIAQNNASRVTANQEPVTRGISLYEAMARALKYNLDHRVEMMQQSLRTTELDLAHYNLLPNAVANSGYAARDSYYSTGELNLVTGQQTPPRTTSQEKRHSISDITFSWNILDFGLSLIRARQSADKVLIAEEAKRKVIQRVIEDVRTAYWRAVSSDRMIQKLKGLEARTKSALDSARALHSGREASPITALTYERELVEITRTAQRLQRELSVSKAQLAALMNLPPDSGFALSSGALDIKTPPSRSDGHDLIEHALLHRPELRDIAYQQRINAAEARAALLELLPGIQLTGAGNYDSNKYIDSNHWVSWGAKSTWNAVRLFQYPAKRDVIEAQDALLDARALALTMAVMTQVHISSIRYQHAMREFRTARDYLDVQSRLVRQMRNEAAAERISEQTLIREELNTLVAEVQRDIAYASTQNAFANIYASIGMDPYADEIDLKLGVSELSSRLRGMWLERGDFKARWTKNVAFQQ